MEQEAHITGPHTGFSHKYNTDDVLIRAVIVGLINSLNYQIYFENVINDTTTQTVRVPFFYAFSGDERFLQDYFSNWSDCAPTFIEGNYDPIPRGSLTLNTVNIQAANQTSRFVRGYYVKEEKGELLRYNSYLNSIPISMSFNVKILVDTMIDAFKINQEIMKVFYKTLVFRVNFGGVVVPSQAGFPETYTTEKQFEYTYGETNRITLSFDVEVETYYPIFDKKQEMFAGSRIEKANLHTTLMTTPSYNSSQDISNVASYSASGSSADGTNTGYMYNNYEVTVNNTEIPADSTFGITDAQSQTDSNQTNTGNSNDSPAPGTSNGSQFTGDYWK